MILNDNNSDGEKFNVILPKKLIVKIYDYICHILIIIVIQEIYSHILSPKNNNNKLWKNP